MVFDRIQEAANSPYKAHYGALAVELPSMIRVNGLHQVLMYLESGINNTDRKAAANSLREHFISIIKPPATAVRDLSSAEYAMLTRRALQAAQYFKRFAESVLKIDRASAEVEP